AVEEVIGGGFRMEHEPVAPVGDRAGKPLKPLAFLRTFERGTAQCGPERTVSSAHDHDASLPAIELVSVIFEECAYVTAVGIIEEQSVGVVDHARNGK